MTQEDTEIVYKSYLVKLKTELTTWKTKTPEEIKKEREKFLNMLYSTINEIIELGGLIDLPVKEDFYESYQFKIKATVSTAEQIKKIFSVDSVK